MPSNPDVGQASFTFVNNGPCPLDVISSDINFNQTLAPQQVSEFVRVV